MKRAFTLVEINLAIMIMAVGILGIISLYTLAYREERQSREDVASAAYADAVMSPLVTALTATNVTWQKFRDLGSYPGEFGWKHYLQNENTGHVNSNPDGIANSAYSSAIGDLGIDFPTSWPVSPSQAGDLKAGLVVMHEQGSPVVRISFRAAAKANTLFSAPLYYTEARFQGVVE